MNDNGPDTMVGAKNGFDLTRQAGTPSFNLAGINGDAIGMDPTSYFTRAFGVGFNPAALDMAFSIWFKVLDNTKSRQVFAFATDPTLFNISLEIRTFTSIDGTIGFVNNNTNFGPFSSPMLINGWNNAIMIREVRTGSNLWHFYLNGNGYGRSTSGAAIDFSTYSLTLGRVGTSQGDGIQYDQGRLYIGSNLGADQGARAKFAVDMWNGGAGFFTYS